MHVQDTQQPRVVASTQPAMVNLDDGTAAPPTDPANDASATIFNPAPQRPLDSIDPFCMLNVVLEKVWP